MGLLDFLSEKKYELMEAGYTAYPKNHDAKDSEIIINARTLKFRTEGELDRAIQNYTERKLLLDQGKSDGERRCILVNQTGIDTKVWGFAIHPEYIRQFGKIKCVIFNCGGVILDDRQTAYAATTRMLNERGLSQIKFEEWLMNAEPKASIFFKKRGLEDPAQDIDAKYNKYFDDEISSKRNIPRLYDDVYEVLNYLKKSRIKNAILSSYRENFLMKMMYAYKIEKLLDCVGENASNKTERILFLCDLAEENPRNCLYIDDLPDGIIAAKKAGAHTAGITTGYGKRAELEKETPEYILKSLSDLKDIFINGVQDNQPRMNTDKHGQ